MNNRLGQRFIKFIAYLQILGIILVVFGHSFHEYPDGNNGTSLLIYRLMYNFRMPLFIFVSGFLMYYTTRIVPKPAPSVSKFLVNKLKRLLLPYLVLSIVTFLPRVTLSFWADSNINLDFNTFFTSILDGSSLVIPYFWFLQASFLLLIVSYTIISLLESAHIPHNIILTILFVAAILLIILPSGLTMIFSVAQAARMAIFFVLGIIYCRYTYVIDKLIPWTSVYFCIITGSVWGFSFLFTENTNFSILSSILGIAMCISIAKIMLDHNLNFLDHLIGANYIIFLLSWFCNVASQQILHKLTDFPWWVYTIVSLISGIYIPWLFYIYIQQHPQSRWVRFSAFMLGQSFKKPAGR